MMAACAASALEPTTPLASYLRQAWGMENGLPQNTVQALAQTSDGFVWLGTEVGLVRFDGVSFQLFDRNTQPALPGNDVRCLLATKDGALWIGTSEGLAKLQDDLVKTFTTANGLPSNIIRSLKRGRLGGVIVATESGEVAVEEGHVADMQMDKLQGPPMGNDVPLANGSHLYVNRRMVAKEPHVPGDDAPGQRWIVGRELPGSRIQTWFADREGALWIGTNAGLARWANGKVQRLPVTDPLATASVLSLMEDREGNIWAGTEADGLHILRDLRFRSVGVREGLSSEATTTVVEGALGKLWVGTSGGGLNALPAADGAGSASGIGVRAYSVRDVLLSDVILSLAPAADGSLWVGTPDGLNRIRGGAVDAFTSADGLPDDFIRSLLVDGDGSLWIGTRHGLTHWTDPGARMALSKSAGTHSYTMQATGRMVTYTQADGLGSDLVGAMVRDKHGYLWVATFAGLSRMRNGRIENFTTAHGLSSNVITALATRANGTLLIGTQDRGWNVWDGKGFQGVPNAGSDHAAIHAVLDDGLGHLWFATGTGIARCDAGIESNADSSAGGCAHWIEFGTADGLRSRETATNSHPSAWRTRDGHLWFATPKGLIEIDPAHFPVNTVAPGVTLERFTIDDVPALHAAHSLTRIPAGHVHFEFDYAGLSFVAPQKVRYRYMLEGFDHSWTEAGARRTAYYTNIPAGHYTFRVQAANNDGVWNTEGAALAFVLRPHFYQTWWFYALLVLGVGGIVLLAQRLRLKRAEREFNAVLGERNRIAREIHDTLAQGYVGISVQLEVLTELLRQSKVDAAQKHLDLTRGYVREGLAEARQSIWALRSQDAGENTLPVRLRRLVESEGGHGLHAAFSIFGAYRPLTPETEQEILRVAQEAVHNVKKHAGAENVFVQLDYKPQEIALEVRDDGRGFTVAQQPEPGHYGLTGMRERAAAIGGALEVASEPGAGTTVRLRVAARREARSE